MQKTSKINKRILFAAWACRNEKYGSAQISEELIRKIFHDVIVFDPQKSSYTYGKEKMNRMLVEIVQKEQPDYLFLWLIYDEISLETLLKIREISPKTRLVNFFGDDDTLYDTYSRFIAPFLDGCLVFQPDYIARYARDGIKNVYRLAGVNTEYYRPMKVKKRYDVSFIGTPKSDRYAIIKFLISKGVNVSVFGAGWERYPDIQRHVKGPVRKEDMVRVINESKISISFTKNYDGKPHCKGRVAEICACRSFLISEAFEGYRKIFRANELVMFKDEHDLLKKIKHYLAHEKERESIAARGYRRVRSELSLEKELRSAFKSLDKKSPGSNAPRLQRSREEIVYLSPDELRQTNRAIISRVKNARYIGFYEKKSSVSPYKEYFQVASLKMSGRGISCCDYYVSSPLLGDYLALYAHRSFGALPPKQFHRYLHLGQLLMKREAFIANLERIKHHSPQTPQPFITEKNCTFVSIPLLRVKEAPSIDASMVDRISLPKYEDTLRVLWRQRTLFFHPFLYALLMRSLTKDRFILDHMWQRIYGKIIDA